jgi:hypothetical protein
MKRRGYRIRLVERRFDDAFRRQQNDPALALCGFDSNSARRDLSSAEFQRVIESGLGETATIFDTISFIRCPMCGPRRSCGQI